MVVNGLVFQYFFQIGAGLAMGIGTVTLGCWMVYRFVLNKLDGRNKKIKQGGKVNGVI